MAKIGLAKPKVGLVKICQNRSDNDGQSPSKSVSTSPARCSASCSASFTCAMPIALNRTVLHGLSAVQTCSVDPSSLWRIPFDVPKCQEQITDPIRTHFLRWTRGSRNRAGELDHKPTVRKLAPATACLKKFYLAPLKVGGWVERQRGGFRRKTLSRVARGGVRPLPTQVQ